jgi:predicted component of type VI protein secretion system
VGNIALSGQCLESILLDKVTIAMAPPLSQHIQDMNLGTGRLGADTVLGEYIQDVLPSFEITVFLSHPEYISAYLPGGTKIALLQWLLTYFIPFEQEFIILIEAGRQQHTFFLSEEAYTSRLGYTTFLPLSA